MYSEKKSTFAAISTSSL